MDTLDGSHRIRGAGIYVVEKKKISTLIYFNKDIVAFIKKPAQVIIFYFIGNRKSAVISFSLRCTKKGKGHIQNTQTLNNEGNYTKMDLT